MFARGGGPARTRGYTPGMPDATLNAVADEQDGDTDELLVDDELLVEEISIDGMCGVY